VYAADTMGIYGFYKNKILYALAHEFYILQGMKLLYLSIEAFKMDGIECLWFFFSIHG